MHDQPALDDRLAQYFSSQAGVLAGYLFGAHAEGRAHRESDVDVAVLLDRARYPTAADRFQARVSMTTDLIAVLHRNEVDLVVLNDVPPGLGRHVVLRGRLIHCADSEAEHAFRRDVQLRAADIAPFLDRTRRAKLRAMRR